MEVFFSHWNLMVCQHCGTVTTLANMRAMPFPIGCHFQCRDCASRLERRREYYRTQRLAHAAVGRAVRNGELQHVNTRDCADCGAQAEHYHHESYDKQDWLSVTPLCVTCHVGRHRGGTS